MPKGRGYRAAALMIGGVTVFGSFAAAGQEGDSATHRADTYGDTNITYLKPTTNDVGETIYIVVTDTVPNAVFGGEDGVFDAATENVTASNIDGFASATDDALQVIEFVHDNEVRT